MLILTVQSINVFLECNPLTHFFVRKDHLLL